MSRAINQAMHIAAMYRRAGYPDAHAAPAYCVDEFGADGFYTYTVSVYVGEKRPINRIAGEGEKP